MFRFLVLFLVMLLVPWSASAAVVVDAAFVEQALKRGAIVWDVRARTDYRKGHVPGAVNIGEAAAELRDPNSEDFIAQSEIETALGSAGIDPAKELVVYGWRGSTTPHFADYALRYFGAGRVHVFHDGYEAWVEAGGAASTDDFRLAPIDLRQKPVAGVAVSTREVVAMVGRGDVQILDARTRREFSGEDVRAIRGGHIPGSINIPYERNWRDAETAQKLGRREFRDTSGMSLKPADELGKLYAGLDPAKKTVVMCQSGVRAAQTANVLRDLGFRDVRIYDSSWIGYAARLDAPAENEVFINVGQMTSRIRELSRRVDDLERQLQQQGRAATCINC